MFNFSDYPQDSKLFDSVDRKGIGKTKDNFKRKIISEFVRLKSKIDVDGKENKKAKGVNRNVAKKEDIRNFWCFVW